MAATGSAAAGGRGRSGSKASSRGGDGGGVGALASAGVAANSNSSAVVVVGSKSAPSLSFLDGGAAGGTSKPKKEKTPEELIAEQIARVEAMKDDPVYPRGRDPEPRPQQVQVVGKKRLQEMRLRTIQASQRPDAPPLSANALDLLMRRDARSDLPVSNAMEMLKLRLRTGGQKWKPPGQR